MQPLHLAVKFGFKDVVQVILRSGVRPNTLLLRDTEGSIPLHSAVQAGSPEITRLLLEASPDAAIHLENGVGETVTEIANFREIVWRCRTDFGRTKVADPPDLPLSDWDIDLAQVPFDIRSRGSEIRSMSSFKTEYWA